MGPMQSRQAERPGSPKSGPGPELFPKLNGYNTLADTSISLPHPALTEFFTVEVAVH